jgi:hypothetical protein
MENIQSKRGRVSRLTQSRKLSVLCVAALLLMNIGGCDLINPDEQIPAYLQLDRYAFTPGVSGGPVTGTPPSAVVYANGLLIGIFDLPAKVPILASGIVDIRIEPAIIPDGQRATRVTYPFYTDYKQKLNLTSGEVTRVPLATTFKEQAIQLPFVVKDDFDDNGSRAFVVSSTVTPKYELESAVRDAPVGWGGGYGRVKGFEGRQDAFILESDWRGFLPQKGKAVYLELDYRSNIQFAVGVASALSTQTNPSRNYRADLTVFPKSEWTKLYVNLTEEVSRVNNDAYDFKIYLQGVPTGDKDDYLAIDNVRLIYPKQ